MAKITFNTFASLANESSFLTQLNENFSDLSTFVDSLLSRDGVAPNFMTTVLDMNSQRIINLGAPIDDTDAVRLVDLQGIVGGSLIPDQTGHAGEFLSTDGTNPLWAASGVPSPLVAGAWMTNNGTATSWSLDVFMNTATGSALRDRAATSTSPTVVPNRAVDDMGLGYSFDGINLLDTLHLIWDGASGLAAKGTQLLLDGANRIARGPNTGSLQISGSDYDTAPDQANIEIFSRGHATQANELKYRSALHRFATANDTDLFLITGTAFESTDSNSFRLTRASGSATVPNIILDKAASPNTGLGSGAAGQIDLISGGASALSVRTTEVFASKITRINPQLAVGNIVGEPLEVQFTNLLIDASPVNTVTAAHSEDAFTDEIEFAARRYVSTAAWGPHLAFTRSRGTGQTETAVAASDTLMRITALGHDGTDYEQAAKILVDVDGTPGNNDMPGRIDFYTTPDGTNVPVLRWSIRQDGTLEGNGALNLTALGIGRFKQLAVGDIATETLETSLTIGAVVYNGVITAHSEGATDLGGLITHRHTATAGFGGHLIFARSRGTDLAETVVAVSDVLGRMEFVGYDGTDYERAAAIHAKVASGTVSATSMPGQIEFYTTPNLSVTPALHWTIRSDGDLFAATGSGPAIRDVGASSTIPTLCPSQADLDTGVTRSGINQIGFVSGGVLRFEVRPTLTMTTVDSYWSTSGGPLIKNSASAATTPVFIPNQTATTTGIGGAAGTLSFITGGSERWRIDASGNLIGEGSFATIYQQGTAGSLTLKGGGGPDSCNIFLDGGTTQQSSYRADTHLFEEVGSGPQDDLMILDRTGLFLGLDVATGTPALLMETPSATNPTVVPNQSDLDTGVTRAAADAVGFVAGAIEAVRYTEASNHIIWQSEVHAGITASTTQTQGNGVLLSSFNQVSTVATTNDTVTLPTAVAGIHCVIINSGANTLQIFPASGDNLGQGLNTATTLSSGSTVHFFAYDATNWAII